MCETKMVKPKICYFIYSWCFPFRSAFNCIYNFFNLNIFVYLSFIIFISIFHIFNPPYFFIIWFLIVSYITQKDFNSSLVEVSFTLTVCFRFFDRIFVSVGRVSSNILFFLHIFRYAKVLVGILFQFFFYYQDLINWYYLIFLSKFFLLSKFSLWHPDTFEQIYIFLLCVSLFPFASLVSIWNTLSYFIYILWQLITVVVEYIVSFKNVRFGLKSSRSSWLSLST